MSDRMERRYAADGTELGPVRVTKAMLGTGRWEGQYLWQGQWYPLDDGWEPGSYQDSDLGEFESLVDAMGADLVARKEQAR